MSRVLRGLSRFDTGRHAALWVAFAAGGCEPPPPTGRCGACAEVCGNGVDDDGDGAADCADPACTGLCPEACADGVDNDLDRRTDCADPDCDGDCPEDCGDLRDNDGDSAPDCADADCVGHCPEACEGGLDDDGDGQIDCADADCAATLACFERDCTNGLDDDHDALIDCEDGQCADDPRCYEARCDDLVDDDLDGLSDCADDDCWGRGCSVTVAWVDGAARIDRFVRILHSYESCYFDVVYGMGEVEQTARIVAPFGRVRVLDGTATAWRTCTWDARSAVVYSTDLQASYFRVEPVLRPGFRVQPGCGLEDAGFLPPILMARPGSVAIAELSPFQLGAPWYLGDPAGTGRYWYEETFSSSWCTTYLYGWIDTASSTSIRGGDAWVVTR